MNWLTDWLDQRRRDPEDQDRLAAKQILAARLIELHVLTTTDLRPFGIGFKNEIDKELMRHFRNVE